MSRSEHLNFVTDGLPYAQAVAVQTYTHSTRAINKFVKLYHNRKLTSTVSRVISFLPLGARSAYKAEKAIIQACMGGKILTINLCG